MDDSTVDPEQPGGGTLQVGRGVFLATLAAGVSSLVWGRDVWSRVSGAIGPVESFVPLVPSKGWRIYSVADSLPTFDERTWRLGVGGLVGEPQAIDYRELLALPRAEQVSTFHCVTGWSVKDVHWAGVRMADVLAAAGPHREALGLRFVSAEKPYDDFLTLEQASLPDVMLAYEMDGEPLSRG